MAKMQVADEHVGHTEECPVSHIGVMDRAGVCGGRHAGGFGAVLVRGEGEGEPLFHLRSCGSLVTPFFSPQSIILSLFLDSRDDQLSN